MRGGEKCDSVNNRTLGEFSLHAGEVVDESSVLIWKVIQYEIGAIIVGIWASHGLYGIEILKGYFGTRRSRKISVCSQFSTVMKKFAKGADADPAHR